LRLRAFLVTPLALAAGALGPAGLETSSFTPREKAALLVVSGLPAPADAGGVIVRRGTLDAARPRDALVFADQEGGSVRAFPDLPPKLAASELASAAEAFDQGRATGRSLGRRGVHVDLAPVLDAPDGPLGSRHFRSASIGVAFGRGLAAGGAGACAKHFPGLGSTAVSTDSRRPVHGVVRGWELAGFRAAIAAGVPCVMIGHAIYPRLGSRPASLEAKTYELLRATGFDGIAITDSLDVISKAGVPRWARLAVLAGADLVLLPEAGDAERAIQALVPLARAGELDPHVARVLRFRRSLGLE
jgi:beta-N-acetylhexosaminidase